MYNTEFISFSLNKVGQTFRWRISLSCKSKYPLHINTHYSHSVMINKGYFHSPKKYKSIQFELNVRSYNYHKVILTIPMSESEIHYLRHGYMMWCFILFIGRLTFTAFSSRGSRNLRRLKDKQIHIVSMCQERSYRGFRIDWYFLLFEIF